jgi:hypothetical protein
MTNPQDEQLAPVYRYFTADLLTNEVLAEIPFQGVNYKRALKSGGEFTGNIPVIEDTRSLNLYESTVPGKTALYVVRNGVCVWGGIIWTRSYDVASRTLSISGSEFPSYFYHRLIWKTWNHQFGAILETTSVDALAKERLVDSFDTNPLNSSKWAITSTAAGGLTPGSFSANGEYSVRFTALGQAVDTAVRTTSPSVDLRRGAISVKHEGLQYGGSDELYVALRVRLGGDYYAWLQVTRDSSGPESVYRLSCKTTSGGTINVVPGSTTGASSFTSPDQIKYLRISALNSTITYSYSSDGVVWNVYHLVTNATTFTSSTLSTAWPELVTSAGLGPASAFPLELSFSDLTYWKTQPVLTAKSRFDNGSTSALVPGSFVGLEFFQPENFIYNGFYKVAASPPPTRDTFSIEGAAASATAVSVVVEDGVATIATSEDNDYKAGDSVRIFGTGPLFDGIRTVLAPAAAGTRSFSFATSAANQPLKNVNATVTRSLPVGLYPDTTVTVRADTYGFVRSLLDAVGNDFVGLDFPNAYIEPGISQRLDVISTRITNGYAEIETSTDHNLAVGQALQMYNLGPLFEGEHLVTMTPSATLFRVALTGERALTASSPISREISSFTSANGLVSVTTTAAHGYLVGQTAEVFLGYDYGDLGGTVTIRSVPSSTTFTYTSLDKSINPKVSLTKATVSVSGKPTAEVFQASIKSNVATIVTKEDHGYAVGDTIVLANVNRNIRLDRKSYDSANDVATFYTAKDHYLQQSEAVVLSGVQDSVVPQSVLYRYASASEYTATMSVPDPGHNFRVGNSVTIEGLQERYTPTIKTVGLTSGTLFFAGPTSINTSDTVFIQGLVDTYSASEARLVNNVATLKVAAGTNISVNDEITVEGIADRKTVVAREVIRVNTETSNASSPYVMVLTMSTRHNFMDGQEITVSGVGGGFDGEKTVLTTTDTRIFFEIPDGFEFSDVQAARGSGATQPSGGVVTSNTSVFNGVYNVSAVSSADRTISYVRSGNDEANRTVTSSLAKISAPSKFNGSKTVIDSVSDGAQISVGLSGISFTVTPEAVPPLSDDQKEEGAIPPALLKSSEINGTRTVSSATRDSVTVRVPRTTGATEFASSLANGFVFANSPFNGTRTVLARPDTNVFTVAMSGLLSSVYEGSAGYRSYAEQRTTYNGTFTAAITEIPDSRTFKFARTHADVPLETINSIGTAVVRPSAVVSTFGPYPGSANINLRYSSRRYSGTRVAPKLYRGFELVSVGDALEEYADTIDGFEYRIDCAYDEDTQSFTKTLVLLPINFPGEPTDGSVSPITRFGAEKLVFEYPGNITTLTIDETAENSATRFFALGENDLGPEAGPPFSVAASDELLNGTNQGDSFRKWPLLDETEQVSGIDDDTVLYAYAQRYLSESRPPEAALKVTVNGSLQPVVGDYAPGDWCSLIVDDEFVRLRLSAGLEPRPDIIIRKIDAMNVTVPDGVTFPEIVTLDLVPEWEVDKRGQQAI